MPLASQPVGRRERNKQDKLDRIIAAAGELFARHGVDEVTTQQIADKADIGTGTLFLYAKTKGELLLLVQNTHYAEALERGRADAETVPGVLDAVLAIVRPIVECNRAQIDNGRTYLREMVFGDPEEPRHREALGIVVQTEEAIAAVLRRDERLAAGDAATLARIVSAVMFLSMAASVNIALSVEEIVQEIRGQVGVLLPHLRRRKELCVLQNARSGARLKAQSRDYHAPAAPGIRSQASDTGNRTERHATARIGIR